jgi:hypothetical protein
MAVPCKELTVKDSKLPIYPSEQVKDQIQGIIKVRATVSSSGSIVDATAIGGPQGLRAAAEDYIQSWVLDAPSKTGNCTQDISVEFKLIGSNVDYPNNYFSFTRQDIGHTILMVHPFKPTYLYLNRGLQR